METIEHIIREWGYLAVFLGSLIEGESIILTAGFLAHEGYLSLWKIIVLSFFGSLMADQALYHVGRHYGSHFLDKYPKFQEPADRAFRLLRRYGNIYIMVFRFIYGIRIISPIIIGVAGIEPKRFTILNLIAAAVWAVLSCLAGYYFAHIVMDEFAHYSKYILIVFLGGVATIWIGLKIRDWRKKKRELYLREKKNNNEPNPDNLVG